MGVGFPGGLGSCSCDPTNVEAIAPNPSPSKWTLLQKQIFHNGFAIKVHYEGCTNYEGVKIMVFEGLFNLPSYIELDPHFSEDQFSPLARFKPTERGWRMAVEMAAKL